VRIAVVGPTHPIKGGIAQHTTVLARRLADAGHDVEIVSWLRQYPQWLYPGEQTVNAPEFPPFAATRRQLSWNRPDSWRREARRLRGADLVVFAHVTPVQAPAYLTMIASIRRGAARVAVICHNVLPHERRRTDVALVSRLLRAADLVLVHSAEQADVARSLTDRPVSVAQLPPSMPAGFVRRTPEPGEHRRIVFFGLVRPYKGLDVLLRAMADGPPDIRLRVAGEVWGGVEQITTLCRDLGITDRVELRPGYVDADAVPALFADVDALVLPYRTATGSQAVWVGFEFGVPVIVTRAGYLADDVRDGVDGVIAEPDDVASLADALRRFYTPGTPERLRERVRPIDPEPYWHRYLDALLDAAETVDPGRAAMRQAAPPGGLPLHVLKRAAEQALWTRVAVGRALVARRGRPMPLPTPVPPCDVLRDREQVEQSVAECRRLGLPLHHDRPKNWDALGAVSTIVNVLGTDVRVLDAGAARYSSVLPWLRMYGVRDLVGINLEFDRTTRHGPVRFEPGDITDTRFADSSFDAITCMSVIEHGVPLAAFVREAARVLRPGGLLVVSTDYDHEPPDTTGITAYGAPVQIFGPDDIRAFVDVAADAELTLMGALTLDHDERPVHWGRTGLDYTFIRVTFVRRG
jgi:glycosyltransferase involved in cell wall biosynthesis/SAM-dependent methyltransferase